MLITIKSSDELGMLLRAARRAQDVRLGDLAGIAGVGHVFVREAEHGVPTVSLGRVLKLLSELGLELKVDAPEEALAELARVQRAGLRPIKRRDRPSQAQRAAESNANDATEMGSA
jgi:transcriptional regulator with XRE-family HTH domain